MRRALLAGMVVLAACRGSKSKATAKDAAVAAEVHDAAPEVDGAAWSMWKAAAAAFVTPPRDAPAFGLVVVDLAAGQPADPRLVEAQRAHVAANRDALLRFGRAARAPGCTAPAPDGISAHRAVAIGLYNVSTALIARAVLAAADGDLDEAVADLVTVLRGGHALTTCRAGAIVDAVATGAEGEVMEIGRALAGRLSPDARGVLARAVADYAIPFEVLANGLEIDAPRAGEVLDAVAVSHTTLAEAVLGNARPVLDAPADPAARTALVALIARHPAAYVPEDSRAAVTDGYVALAGALRRYREDLPPLAMEPAGRRAALLDELGPATVVIVNPGALRAPIAADVERAFVATENPIGRHLATRAIEDAVFSAAHGHENLTRTAEAREALLDQLREPDSGAY